MSFTKAFGGMFGCMLAVIVMAVLCVFVPLSCMMLVKTARDASIKVEQQRLEQEQAEQQEPAEKGGQQ
jgi:uncharacterized membrane protein